MLLLFNADGAIYLNLKKLQLMGE